MSLRERFYFGFYDDHFFFSSSTYNTNVNFGYSVIESKNSTGMQFKNNMMIFKDDTLDGCRLSN